MPNPTDEPPTPPPPPRHLEVVPPDDYTRTPPNDLAAEQAVLGSMMLSREAITDALAILYGTEFYRPAHELIYQAILNLHLEGAPVDVITVNAHLQTRGESNRTGGPTYLDDLTTGVVTPVSAGYYARIIRDRAIQRAYAEAGTRIEQLGYTPRGDIDDIRQAADQAYHHATTAYAATAKASSTWAPVDLTTILDGTHQDAPPPTTLTRTDGPALLYTGAVHSLAGEPESGKSWVALLAAAQELTKGNPVVYVDFEDRPARVVGRLLELGATPQRVGDLFRYIRPDVALTRTTAAHLAAATDGTTLAVIDGITEAMTLHGLSLLDNEDVARWLSLLPRRLADIGPAVLQIDHVIKNPEARGRYAIGGQHKLAGIDGAAYKITVTEPFGRGKRGHARITVDKDREGYVRKLAMGLTVATLTIDNRPSLNGNAPVRAYLDPPTMDTTDDGGFRPTGIMEKVSRFVELNPACTQNTIEETVRGRAHHVRDAVRALVREGYLRVEAGPRNSVLHSVDVPFRDAD